MNKTTVTHSSPLLSLLAVLFIGLKLTGYITWSWWWVLSPIWIPLALVLLFFGGLVVLAIAASVVGIGR